MKRDQWIQHYGIRLLKIPDDFVGKPDPNGEPWAAYYAETPKGFLDLGKGATEDEALKDYARRVGYKLWNEGNP